MCAVHGGCDRRGRDAVYASRARPLDRREADELIEAEGGSLWAACILV